MRVYYVEFEGVNRERYGARYMRYVAPDLNGPQVLHRPLYAAARAWRATEEHGLLKIKDRYTDEHGIQELTPEIMLMMLSAKDLVL
jgi:hypothetical protein